MRKKYADFIYTVKNTDKGYVWTIWGDGGKPMQTSTESEDEDFRYFKTKTAAQSDAIEAIQDHYS